RRRLGRAGEIRIAKGRGARMGVEYGDFRTNDAVTLLVDRRFVDEWRVLAYRYGKAGRIVQGGVRPTAVGGDAADGDEVPAASLRDVRHHAQPAVHRADHVPLHVAQCRGQGLLVVGFRVDVLEVGRVLRT